jgi:hypothetical protein
VNTFPIDLDPLAIPNPPQPFLCLRIPNRPLFHRRRNGTNGPQNYEVAVPAITTMNWAVGWYRWQAYITDSSTPPNRRTVAEGTAQVLPDLQPLTCNFDAREPDEIMLDAVLALMGNKVFTDAQEYRIQERELRKHSWEEITKLRNDLEARVRAIRIRRGELPFTQTIGVSFGSGY